jgi:DNA-binding NtrC family response regulator
VTASWRRIPTMLGIGVVSDGARGDRTPTASRLGSTLLEALPGRAPLRQRELVVVEPTRTDIIPLAASGSLRIARDPKAAIYLTDPAASRDHAATLHVEEGRVLIEAHAKTPIRVGGVVVPPHQMVEFGEGQCAALGDTLLFVRRTVQRMSDRLVWGHEYFKARLIEACEAAPETAFCVARFQLRAEAVPDLAEALPPRSVLACFGGSHYEALIFGVTASNWESLRERLQETLGESLLKVGAAWYPRHGRKADKLISFAAEQLLQPKPPEPTRLASKSPQLEAIYRQAATIGKSGTNRILIVGETGAGKEVLARFIHDVSSRASKPFLRINCAAIPETLVESELYGHEEHAFTGSVARPGVLRQADGGTLLLDEFGDLPLRLQEKLLSAFGDAQVTRVRPVGADREEEVDVRVIATTNRDIVVDAQQRRFRADLYHRFAAFTLALPRLAQRQEDILALAASFVLRFASRERKPGLKLSTDAEQLLVDYDWPGNIRQLQNVIERGVVLCEGDMIHADHLDPALRSGGERFSSTPFDGSWAPPVRGRKGLGGLSREQARDVIGRALLECGCNKERAVKLLEVDKNWLLDKMEEVGLPVQRAKPVDRAGKPQGES